MWLDPTPGRADVGSVLGDYSGLIRVFRTDRSRFLLVSWPRRSHMQPTTEQRVFACLKGIAVGDAIGKQTENLSHGSTPPSITINAAVCSSVWHSGSTLEHRPRWQTLPRPRKPGWASILSRLAELFDLFCEDDWHSVSGVIPQVRPPSAPITAPAVPLDTTRTPHQKRTAWAEEERKAISKE